MTWLAAPGSVNSGIVTAGTGRMLIPKVDGSRLTLSRERNSPAVNSSALPSGDATRNSCVNRRVRPFDAPVLICVGRPSVRRIVPSDVFVCVLRKAEIEVKTTGPAS